MKTLVLIACLLIEVYALNPVVQGFNDNIAKCAQELNKPPTEDDVLYCALNKEGLIDEGGKYILAKGLVMFDDLISDEAKRNQAKEGIRKCYENMSEGPDPEANKESIKQGIQCSKHFLALVDQS